MASSAALISAVLWVLDHLEDVEWKESGKKPVKGVQQTMWNYAAENRAKFFEKFVPQAMVYREREEKASGALRAQELEEAEIERLHKRLRGFMAGRKRVFCEKCWRELEKSGELGPVEVVHQRGISV